ncbi:hypothetical protein H6P81_004915 [Aristolochia fimbriata]|uniref:F-box protein At3g26010-like beta-propeller domain-containing protein n=1 Tax=Aristolochia fimbriata TaxID=158543 RepID=A0AAV7EWJ1_ARIFI|nr:hypothetical protein H6P81_004915 [Aristolochia fimbriata]
MEESKSSSSKMEVDSCINLGTDVWEDILFRLPYEEEYIEEEDEEKEYIEEEDEEKEYIEEEQRIEEEEVVQEEKTKEEEKKREEEEDLGGGRLSLEFLPFYKEEGFKMEDTCNGLLLCSSNRKIPGQHNLMLATYYLCNPLTKEWIEVGESEVGTVSSAALVFDVSPSLSSSLSQYYFKLVILSFIPMKYDALNLVVFSSKTGHWVGRTMDYAQARDMYAFMLRPWHYLNGVLYKLSRPSTLLCIDINEEENWRLSSIALPVIDRDDDGREILCTAGRTIAPFDGCLHVIQCVTPIDGCSDNILKIWKLEEGEEGSKWVYVHRIPYHRALRGGGKLPYHGIRTQYYEASEYSNYPLLPPRRNSELFIVVHLNKWFMDYHAPPKITEEDGLYIFRYNLKTLVKVAFIHSPARCCGVGHIVNVFPFSPYPLPLPTLAS